MWASQGKTFECFKCVGLSGRRDTTPQNHTERTTEDGLSGNRQQLQEPVYNTDDLKHHLDDLLLAEKLIWIISITFLFLFYICRMGKGF